MLLAGAPLGTPPARDRPGRTRIRSSLRASSFGGGPVDALRDVVLAAAAAFANPVPSLDLLATATINAQMVVDLGALYQQQFSLEQAKTVTGNLGSQMVKLGLVEMASQAISPLLKSHALTYMAGGTIQGLSAAYLTRVAGLSLVEYFEEQSQSAESGAFQLDRLLQKVKAVFQDNQRSAFLQNLVKQGLARLVPQATSAPAS